METNLVKEIEEMQTKILGAKTNITNIINLIPNSIDEAKKTATQEQINELDKLYNELQFKFKML